MLGTCPYKGLHSFDTNVMTGLQTQPGDVSLLNSEKSCHCLTDPHQRRKIMQGKRRSRLPTASPRRARRTDRLRVEHSTQCDQGLRALSLELYVHHVCRVGGVTVTVPNALICAVKGSFQIENSGFVNADWMVYLVTPWI